VEYLPHTIIVLILSIILCVAVWLKRKISGRCWSVTRNRAIRIIGDVALMYSVLILSLWLIVESFWITIPIAKALNLTDNPADSFFGIYMLFGLSTPMTWHPVSLLIFGISIYEFVHRIRRRRK
jgi:hypothetical protein